MKQRILLCHRWILTGYFLFALFLMISIGFSAGAIADEGHVEGGKKSSAAPKKAGDDNHVLGKPLDHSSNKEAHGHGMGAMGVHRHGEVPKGHSPLLEKGFQLMSDLHCNACHYISPGLEHGVDHGGVHAAWHPI